jgi:hypothetical protein
MTAFELHYTPMPDSFVRILTSNMQTSSAFYGGLRQYIAERKDLAFLVKHSFQDIDSSGQIDKVIKALGWFGVRNRLAHAYLYKMTQGVYPQEFGALYTDELVKLEEAIQRFSVNGYSRFYLLGLYLLMMMTDLRVTKPDEDLETYLPMNDLVELLSASKARIIKIDWMILVLIALRSSLGQSTLMEKLQKGSSWRHLYSLLQPIEQEQLVKNLALYGAIINEEDMLVDDLA